ncbi:MAG: gamma-butyrobetaine hydroxylase-like domain-containing protein [Cellvibrionaceae bacterium]
MHKPSKIHLHKKSKTLELVIQNTNHELSAEFLRVHSPSAEVKGHGPGQETLVHSKIDVGISNIKATGNYGITIIFDDKHDSGIYSWSYLGELAENKDKLWEAYLEKLKRENKTRDPHTTVVQFSP